jgi:putative transposase
LRQSSTVPGIGDTLAVPRISSDVEALIVRLARENGSWGYDRIAGALKSLDHEVSDQTVGNVLRRHGIEPAPKRGQSTSWSEFIRAHMELLAGMDFFTVEVLTWSGLATYYVLFLIHLESRRIAIAGITRHPTQTWNRWHVTDESTAYLRDIRYVLHDRGTKFCASFESILTTAGVKALKLPARSPNLNAFAERWVRSAKEECLSKLILSVKAL